MKIIANWESRIANCEWGKRDWRFAIRHSERGMATIMLLVLMFIMVSLVMAESVALFRLHQGIKLVEQRQIQRVAGAQTHSIAASQPGSK